MCRPCAALILPRVAHPRIRNGVPSRLRTLGISWTELARRTLLPSRVVRRLRAPDANPQLAVAERVAAALEMAVEDLWTLGSRGHR